MVPRKQGRNTAASACLSVCLTVNDRAAIDPLPTASHSDGAGTDHRSPRVQELSDEVAALRSEIQRMSAQLERHKADIAALEKERARLANRPLLGLTVFSAEVAGAPRTVAQRARQIAGALVRRALAKPEVRTVLRRIRNRISVP